MKDTTEIRQEIAGKVRDLRRSRSWTQTELAERLGISQNWLSELERGEGSFTAEHFLLLLRLFNVSQELQNTLVRLGASHLQESSNALPSSELEDVHRALLEALLDATPRVITGIGPVLVNNADRINLWKVAGSLSALGLETRLPWVIDNTVEAIETLKKGKTALAPKYKRAEFPLRRFLDKAHDLPRAKNVDVLDLTVRSQKTLDDLQRKASRASQRWGIVTAIQPEDFVDALEAADERR